MRIGINGWFWGQRTTGSGQYLHHLLEHLLALEPDNEYLLLIPSSSPGHRGRGELRGMENSVFSVLSVASPFDQVNANLAKVWFEQIAFPWACRRLGCDLAHVPYWASPLFPRIPTVVTVHDLIPLLLPAYRGGPLVRLYTRLVAWSARRASLVLTDSQASRRDIIQHLGIPPERVWAIPLAAAGDFRPVTDPARLQEVRRRHRLPERYLLYLGGLDVRKNVPLILHALARTRRETRKAQEAQGGEDIHLVIVGRLPERDTPFFPDPRRVARELGVEKWVHFVGWIEDEDKAALYSGARAFVFPSLYEGFGLPPLEAMSCGTPVIASTAGSLPEVVGDGGLLVDPADEEALARAMLRLWTDDALHDQLRERALAQAARFTWERTAQETLEAYHVGARHPRLPPLS